MMGNTVAVLTGAVAATSAISTVFFLRFWRQTRDSFFLFMAIAFAIDALTRFSLGVWKFSEEAEPLVYCARLVMFGLIIVGIARKNRPG
jgi:hypothetical protein